MNDFEFFQTHEHDADDFLFELDEYRNENGDQMILAHILVRRFDKAVCKKMLQQWRVLRQFVKCPIFISPMVSSRKWIKFVTMMGFRPFQQVTCNDGAQRQLYIHTI